MSENKKLNTGTEMLNVREACVLMRMSDAGLYGLVQRGVLPKPTRIPTPTTTGGMIELNHWSLDDLLDAKTSGKVRPRKKYAIGETGKRHKVTAAKEAGLSIVATKEPEPTPEPVAAKEVDPVPMTAVQEALDVTKEHVEPAAALHEIWADINRDRSFMLKTALVAGVAIGAALVLLIERLAQL